MDFLVFFKMTVLTVLFAISKWLKIRELDCTQENLTQIIIYFFFKFPAFLIAEISLVKASKVSVY